MKSVVELHDLHYYLDGCPFISYIQGIDISLGKLNFQSKVLKESSTLNVHNVILQIIKQNILVQSY